MGFCSFAVISLFCGTFGQPHNWRYTCQLAERRGCGDFDVLVQAHQYKHGNLFATPSIIAVIAVQPCIFIDLPHSFWSGRGQVFGSLIAGFSNCRSHSLSDVPVWDPSPGDLFFGSLASRREGVTTTHCFLSSIFW